MIGYVKCVFYCLSAVFFFKALAFLVRKRFQATFTAMEDIPLLGLQRKNGRKMRGTAVICGGSIGGLLSARVCADHFEHVLIVEPDAWVATEEGLRDRHRETSTPDAPVPNRSRVMQYKSVHLYQAFNLIALRKLFPDFDGEIQRAGGRILPADYLLHSSGIPIKAPYHEYPDGLPNTIFFSRPGYETTLRRLVLSTCSNVRYITGSVDGLVPHPSRHAVASVIVRTPDATSTEISAILVVDCTGSSAKGLRWLREAPFHVKSTSGTTKGSLPLDRLKTTYDPKMAYTTCEFNLSPALQEQIKMRFPHDYESHGVLYAYSPRSDCDSQMFTITRREKNYMQVLGGGWGFRGKMTSVSDLKKFVSQLSPHRPIPQFVHQILDILQEEDVPATYTHARVHPCTYVRYHLSEQLPSNFIAVGDSVLQLNPSRGQGCAKACIEAVTPNAMLALTYPVTVHGAQHIEDALPEAFSRNYFLVQAKRTGPLWDTHKVLDYGWSSTVPTQGDDIHTTGVWKRWYSNKMLELSTKDSGVASDFWHVSHFLAPPTDMFSPCNLRKVAWTQIIQSLGL